MNEENRQQQSRPNGGLRGEGNPANPEEVRQSGTENIERPDNGGRMVAGPGAIADQERGERERTESEDTRWNARRGSETPEEVPDQSQTST